MKRISWKKIALTLGAVLLSGSLGFAQSGSTDESKRKVKTRVAPVYPDLARRMSISGKVKIEVVISPDGHVKSTRAIGGHPLLVKACEEALKDWKFVAAPEETTQILEFDFRPGD